MYIRSLTIYACVCAYISIQMDGDDKSTIKMEEERDTFDEEYIITKMKVIENETENPSDEGYEEDEFIVTNIKMDPNPADDELFEIQDLTDELVELGDLTKSIVSMNFLIDYSNVYCLPYCMESGKSQGPSKVCALKIGTFWIPIPPPPTHTHRPPPPPRAYVLYGWPLIHKITHTTISLY